MVKAGVHQYSDDENHIYAKERLLSVHFKQGVKKKIALPKVYWKVVDVMAENSSEFIYDFKSPDTVLFEVIK